MTKYRISYIVDGFHDVIPNREDSLQIRDVLFHYRERERIGTVILESYDESDAKREALQKVDKSLSEVCFAYNTEALIKKTDCTWLTLQTNRIQKEFHQV